MNIKLAIQKRLPRKFREEQIDVVTKLTTGKGVKDLAEEALDIATENLTDAEGQFEEKEIAHEKAKVELESANIAKNLRKKDFDTVAEVLE